MPEYIVYAELKILGKAYVKADSLDDAKEEALRLTDEDFDVSLGGEIDGVEPTVIYEADEDGFMDYNRPHLEKVSDVSWMRVSNGI